MTSPVQAPPAPRPGLIARLSAEALGTMFLVLVAVGVQIFSNPQAGPLPATLAAGLAVTAAMLAFGYVSGGHFNPAITLGSLIAGRIRPVAALAYVLAQVAGAVVGAALAFFVVLTVPVLTDARGAFGTVAAGFGEHSAAQTQLAGVLLVEVIGSALLVAVYLGATAGRRAIPALAPFAVGLALAVLLQLGQVLGNLPFNPARATGQAFFSPSWALESLWLFWVAPLMGAALAGFVFRGFSDFSPAPAGAGDAPEEAAEETAEEAADDDTDDDTAAEEAGRADAGADAAAGSRPVKPAANEARDFFDGRKG
ncbi:MULTISPECIES: MIP/aquaporin family protein [unclassified Paenarthrobacter]|uniref:MIP/aquaporin family protein n=1 Tax=unclassified Paenarthrobacter TaxID=2634190 RepID=UPI003CF204A5